jgi:hypothetical protein
MPLGLAEDEALERALPNSAPAPAATSASAVQSVGCAGRSTSTTNRTSVHSAGCQLAVGNVEIYHDEVDEE